MSDVLAQRTEMRFATKTAFESFDLCLSENVLICFFFFNSICVFRLSLCSQKVFAQLLFILSSIRSRFIAETMFGKF